ncbi:prenyltransferase/squalene oxidase repeat-containing protein [Umezawaea endophytica]|uniref:Prenyltransferase n=1 Tax=Umezawaea endophytica TaxID=1654476 RepID=A0A9X3AJC8_9PSEU|nr:prenyltransferase/squalene oxidase repeat-containing protein [Umezawaea endophytica]MCS7483826.1 prenyltransferase [Umezawaea endophytica]
MSEHVATSARGTGDEMLDVLRAHHRGRISLSVYETGRVAALAPKAHGQRSRIQFLLAEQRSDGLWGGPGSYALVPTLSAVDALLTTGSAPAAARTGLAALHEWLARHHHDELPDTVAAELIVPALTDSINRHLPPHRRLRSHVEGREALTRTRRVLSSGTDVPAKLLHVLEIAPDLAPLLTSARPVGGLIGASPAATAAWLGGRTSAEFDVVLDHHGGPVPAFHPITNLERAWVLPWLRHTGADVRQVPLADPGDGVFTAAGLPVDADTTGATLFALALQGRPQHLDALWQFEQDDHFATWIGGERTPSPTTNAHVLEALGANRNGDPRIDAAIDKIGRWLVDRQRKDGSWVDKWHASPHYATFCCATALHRFGGPGAARAVTAAATWVLETQRPEGAWGHWGATAEETAYATTLLLRTTQDRRGGPVCKDAARRLRRATDGARDFLLQETARPQPALWHDKDLYTPHTVVESAVLAAVHQLRASTPQDSAEGPVTGTPAEST